MSRPTLTVDRRVLAVARTVPATRRVLDLLAVLDGDRRVSVTFAYDAGSAFGAQVPEVLAATGAQAIPFDRAVEEPWDLAVAASANGPLYRLSAPLFVVPHGAGHSRRLASGSAPVLGMAPEQLMHDGRVVPAVIGLPHPDDARRLADQCPAAVPYAEIIGDPCWDRLLASRHRRARYRGAFGVGRERLVVVSSTWGPASLFARHPDLIERLTADLPWDDYRVALILHPAVRAWHSEQQVRRWLRPALDRGLILLSPDDEWRAALVAADLVIGDHGSVTLYAAALGRPTALACFSWEEIAPDTPMVALTRTVADFAAEKPVWPQVEALIEDAARGTAPDQAADQATDLAARSFGHQGRSLDLIEEIVYRLMSLSAPARHQQAAAVALPSRPDSAPTSWYFHAELGDGEVTVLRWPAPWSPVTADPGKARLMADVHDPNPRLVRAAAVLIRRVTDEAGSEPEADLADFPAAYVRAVIHPGRVILTVRDQGTFEAITDHLPSDFDPGIIAAAAQAIVFQARQPLGPQLRISVNRRTLTVPVRAASSPSPCPAT